MSAPENAREQLGRAGERLAERFLKKRGFKLIARRFSTPVGELDLIMRDHDTLVFVEVKTRSGTVCGSPLEAVDPRKQRRLVAAAQHFLVTHRCGGCPSRFDVIGVLWRGEVPEVEHVPNAFERR